MLAAYPAPKEPDIQAAFKVLLIFHFLKSLFSWCQIYLPSWLAKAS